MSLLLAERSGDVLVLTMNRPEKANALCEALQDALVAQFRECGDDVRAVVLAASGGRVFSAGADLKEFSELERTVAAGKRRALLRRTLETLLEFPKPLVAAVQGKALGAGAMLALLADEIVMGENAQLGLPEIVHGMPTPVGYAIVTARAGMPVARRLVQTGESLVARSALAAGLADVVTDEGNEKAKALEIAAGLAPRAGPAYQVNKRFMNAGLRAALDAAFAEVERL